MWHFVFQSVRCGHTILSGPDEVPSSVWRSWLAHGSADVCCRCTAYYSKLLSSRFISLRFASMNAAWLNGTKWTVRRVRVLLQVARCTTPYTTGGYIAQNFPPSPSFVVVARLLL